jgi:uncharacterized protein YcbX
MQVSAIAIYPLKSGRGMPLGSAQLERRGLAGDRRWMVVDRNGRFVSQREMPGLARIVAEPTEGGLRLALDADAIAIESPPADAIRRPMRIWDDALLLPEAERGSAWLSARLGEELRLVHQPDDVERLVEEWAEPETVVSLADGFPLLIATTASLTALNEAAPAALGMERFRPNLVVDGADPWAEDRWERIRVGNVELGISKPCPRCTTTTVDQRRGEFDGDEPLATLRRIRMSADGRVPGMLFGWNAAPRSLGPIHVGDPVTVVAARAPWPVRRSAGREPHAAPPAIV